MKTTRRQQSQTLFFLSVILVALVMCNGTSTAQCNWTTEDTFFSPDSSPTGQMGFSVAIDGDVMVAGRPGSDEVCPEVNWCNSGSAVVYRYDGTAWQMEQILYASDAELNDHFGEDVAIQGDVIIIGSPRRNGHGGVYAFSYNEVFGAWMEEAILVQGGAEWTEFGDAVSFSRSLLVVGAPSEAISQGRAFVFQRQTAGWVFIQTLVAFDAANGDEFGLTVDIDATFVDGAFKAVIVVGAMGDDTGVGFDAGSAYVYRLSGGTFVLDQKLTASDAAANDFYGSSVGVHGDHILVGAIDDEDAGADAGALYAYKYNGATWDETDKLIRPSAQPLDKFGYSLDMSAWTAVVQTNNLSFDTELLRFDGAEWEFESTVNVGYASGLAIQGNRAVIGTSTDDTAAPNAGKVTIVEAHDTDGDGLLDCWETNGIPIPNDPGTYILPGADPMRKDLYLELDAMFGNQPHDSIIAPVIAAFANSTVDNPDSSTGITLHVDIDDGDITYDTTQWTVDARFDSLKAAQFGTASERSDPNVVEAKKRAYRYCFLPANLDRGTLGLAEGPGNDFLVGILAHMTIANWELELAATIMHEFGHNLGLGHGGVDPINFKPNYVSVMNYLWSPAQVQGIAWPLDYSRAELDALNENNLDETAPIGDPSGLYGATSTMFLGKGCNANYCEVDSAAFGNRPWKKVLIGSEPVGDWDADNVLNETGVCADANYLGSDAGYKSAPSPCDVLVGHDDWSNLVYAIDGSGDNADKIHTTTTTGEATSGFLDWVYNTTTAVGDPVGPKYEYALEQNYPNPFNPTTTIRFSLAKREHVTVRVYDVAGRLVRMLSDEVLAAGPHRVQWDGRNTLGAPVSSGVYFYAVDTPSTRMSKKMLLLK